MSSSQASSPIGRTRGFPALSRRTIADTLLASVLLLAYALGLWLAAPFLLVVFFVFPPLLVVAPLVFAPPILVMWYGANRGRSGFIIAPIVSVVAVLGWLGTVRVLDGWALEALATAELAAPGRAFDVIAIDGIDTACEEACVRIIATSDRTVAWKGASGNTWVQVRRAESCREDAAARNALDFLARGYRGICAHLTTRTDIGDALLLRIRRTSPEKPDPALPARFSGVVHAIIARTAGHERVLARRVTGRLAPPFPALIGSFGRLSQGIDHGPQIDEREFLALAAGVPVNELDAPQLRPSVSELLDETESYFDDRSQETADRAARVWRGMATNYGRAHGAVLKPRIARMIAGEDVRRLGVGLNSILSLGAAERAFAEPRLLELAFSPLLASHDAPIAGTLRTYLGLEGPAYPQHVRDRAKARFLQAGALTAEQRQVFFVLMVRGGAETRREAVEALFSLTGAAFEDAVRAIKLGEAAVWARNEPTRWSRDEIPRLIARAAEVPNERLSDYLSSFRFDTLSKDETETLVRQVKERLAAAEASGADAKQIEALKRLLETIPSNRAS